MGIASDGSYGIPKGIVSSMPVICKDGDYEIVKGLKVRATKRGEGRETRLGGKFQKEFYQLNRVFRNRKKVYLMNIESF